MNTSLFELLGLVGGRRQFSLWRIVGPGAWLSIGLWSVVALVGISAVREPGFLTALGSSDGLGAAAGLVLNTVPLLLVPLVVVVVAVVVVPLRAVREVRHTLRRNRRSMQADRLVGSAGGSMDGLVGGGLLGGVLAGGLGGALSGGLDDAVDFGGDDGDE